MKYEIVIDYLGCTKTKKVSSLEKAKGICDSALEVYGADCAAVYDSDDNCVYEVYFD